MENFNKEIVLNRFAAQIVRFTEEGFESAPVVMVQTGPVSSSEPYTTEVHQWRETVPSSEIQKAYRFASKGIPVPCSDKGGPLSDSYYWLVRRKDGSLYPWPLLFCPQDHRQREADRRNDEEWEMFYKGNSCEPSCVDCPSESEVLELLAQVEAYISQGETPWDDLDQRGGLTPRWAA